MNKLYLAIIFLTLFTEQALSVKLSEALQQAYEENPILNAERENINISKENINISKSQFLPSMSISGSKSKEDTNNLTNQDGSGASISDVNPLIKTFLIEQILYDGKNRSADLEKNRIGLDLAKANLLKVEQETIYKAIESYTGLILANKKLLINKKNLDLLRRQVETDKARLELGQITLSDLAQSESYLAGAQAKLIQEKNNVITSRLIYENIIGPIYSKDFKEDIDLIFEIPKNFNEANKISIKNNPNLIISKLEYNQSEKDIEIARSTLLPSATLSFEASQSEDFSSIYNEKEKTTLKATIKWPFYSGGKNRSTINKNKNIKLQKKLLLDSSIKTNKANVASAWSSLQSSRSLLESVRLQVKAAEIANEGIAAEYESGLGRSTLDVIQSNSILLSAKITLADSERNYLLSRFKILKSIGLLNKKYLKFK